MATTFTTKLVGNFAVSSSPLGGKTGCNIAIGNHSYGIVEFSATTATAYTVESTGSSNVPSNDTFMAVYSPSFDPANPTANLIGCDDDSGLNLYSMFTINLAAGAKAVAVITTNNSGSLTNATVNGSITPDVTLLPTMRVSGSGRFIANGDASPTTDDHTDFRGNPPGTPFSRTYTIANVGPSTLNLTGSPLVVLPECSSEFSVTAQPATPVAATSGTTNFTIRYLPTNVGTDTCTVSIANDSSTNPYTFAIQGTGTYLPGAPTSVTATAGNAKATVSWSAPASDGGATITDYTATSTPGGSNCTTTGATTCTVTGLSNGTAYTFGVTATNSAGSGPAGTSNSVTPVGLPGTPTSVTATAGNAQATVSWTAPANNGGATITGYTVNSTPGSLTCTTAGATTCTVTGLSNGTAYTFAVKATNSVGIGTAGTSNSVTPDGGYTVTPSAGANGSISPNTPQTVNQGATASFTVTPTTGYAISSVTGCGGNLTGNTYVTAAITGNCTVTASFAATDIDGNGMSDAQEQSIKDNYGMSSGELNTVSLPVTATLSAWVKLSNVERVPFCLFDVSADGSYAAHCITLTYGDNGTVKATVSENGAVAYQSSDLQITDGQVYFNFTKNTNAFGVGLNGTTLFNFTGSANPTQYLLGADLDQNFNAKRTLSPLGVISTETTPVLNQTSALLSDSELAAVKTTTKPVVADVDNDSIPTVSDNCPTIPNFDQADADGNGVGDVCDGGTIDGRLFSNDVPGTAEADTIFARVKNRTVHAGDGNDLLVSGPGRQDEFGEAGADVFAYDTVDSRGDYLSDFTVGTDKIRLTKLLASVNYAGSNPITDGYVGFRDATGGCYLTFDLDGSVGKAGAMLFVYVRNVSCAALNSSANFVF